MVALDWASLTVSGAFVLGATLATIAALRVVRAITAMFEADPNLRRRRRRRRDLDDDDDD